jgi:hypothetical protein
MKREARNWVIVLVLAVAMTYILPHGPERWLPHHGDGRWHNFPILSDSSFFPESLAANAGQNSPVHGAWFGASAGPGTLGGSSAIDYPIYLPSPADQAYVCETKTFYILTNTTGSNATAITPVLGTTNSLYGGCPLFPYYAGAGGHPNPPTGYNGIVVPANQSIVGEVARSDGIFDNPWGYCGSDAINSATYSSGTVTLNLAASQSLWTGGTGPGQYIQINGSSVSALNTPPGTTVGTNLYQLTNETSTTLQFAGTSAQACSSSCGTAYSLVEAGSPPYTMPTGGLGTGTPAVDMYLGNSGSVSINYDLSSNIWCLPMIANNRQPDGTAGTGASATGGMNGVAF